VRRHDLRGFRLGVQGSAVYSFVFYLLRAELVRERAHERAGREERRGERRERGEDEDDDGGDYQIDRGDASSDEDDRRVDSPVQDGWS
tara:strand:- start:913 stop:1176 length:264 start_codon:yes stop_codon:yes gene_type:complete